MYPMPSYGAAVGPDTNAAGGAEGDDEGMTKKPIFEGVRDLLASEILCDKCKHGYDCNADETPCAAYEALENDMMGGV